MSYFTPRALTLLQGFESSGDPLATTSASSASGLYGFTTGTWQQYAPAAGVDIGTYPYAYTAPAEVQTSVAQVTPASNWLCPGCDAGISASVAADPSLLSDTPVTAPLSVSSADLTSADLSTAADYSSSPPDFSAGGSPSVFQNFFGLPATGSPPITIGPGAGTAGLGYTETYADSALSNFNIGLPDVTQAIRGATNAVTGTISGAASNATSFLLGWLERGGVMLLAIVLAAVGLIMLAMGSKTVREGAAAAIPAGRALRAV